MPHPSRLRLTFLLEGRNHTYWLLLWLSVDFPNAHYIYIKDASSDQEYCLSSYGMIARICIVVSLFVWKCWTAGTFVRSAYRKRRACTFQGYSSNSILFILNFLPLPSARLKKRTMRTETGEGRNPEDQTGYIERLNVFVSDFPRHLRTNRQSESPGRKCVG
ncbi:hypothetical protein HDF14_003589 [Edaphobacter lichenicola]|uniref:Uncharacterized protein n=1 Tax=Tunturiibacter gelidiferens TaxID=3069689 RepID=A0A9X0QGI8_9BACT|nr:hypothetical protein [Edaphobacter lichenicola]